MTSLFASPEAKATMIDWFHRFRAGIGRQTESVEVPSRFGPTHVLRGGPRDGPPVVILHGALASSAHALHELAPLLDTFRVHAVDIPGQSPMSAEARPSVKNDDYGHWLVEVMDGLGLERAHVLGVSLGGFVAIRLASVAGDRIERLALLVPAGVVRGPVFAGIFKLGIPMARYRRSPTQARRDAFLRNLLTTPDGDWADYLGNAFRSYEIDMQVPALLRPGELEGCAAPTLVLGAERDLSFPGRKLLDRAPKVFPGLVATELLEGSLHCPPTTDEFRRWLAARLTRFFHEGL